MGSAENARAKVERLVGLSDIVKASDEDLAWLAPGAEPEEVAAAWLSSVRGRSSSPVASEGAYRRPVVHGTFVVSPIVVDVATPSVLATRSCPACSTAFDIADLVGETGREALRAASAGAADAAPLRRRVRVGLHLLPTRLRPARPCTSSRPGHRPLPAASGRRISHRLSAGARSRSPRLDGMPEFAWTDLLPTGSDETPYRLLTTEGVRADRGAGRTFLEVDA